MDSPPALPKALAELVSELEQQSFAVTASEYSPESFGNQVLELESPSRPAGRKVRLVRDRGLWSVDVELGGEWFGPHELMLALSDEPYSQRALSHEERRAMTLEILSQLPTDPAQLAQVEEKLMEYRREYNRQFRAELERHAQEQE